MLGPVAVKHVEVNGVNLTYTEHGTGVPMVFVHELRLMPFTFKPSHCFPRARPESSRGSCINWILTPIARIAAT